MRPFGAAQKVSAKIRAWRTAAGGLLRRHRRRVVISGSAVAATAILTVVVILARRAELRIVNTHEEPLILFVDGKRKVDLPTVAAETPDAGVTIRLSPGTHRFRTETPGGLVVDDLDIHLQPAEPYLVAPGHTDQCFFLEHTAYGEAKPRRPDLTAFARDERIWKLPDEVDAWFVPNPPPSVDDKRSTGGTRTAVRQTRCGFTPWK